MSAGIRRACCGRYRINFLLQQEHTTSPNFWFKWLLPVMPSNELDHESVALTFCKDFVTSSKLIFLYTVCLSDGSHTNFNFFIFNKRPPYSFSSGDLPVPWKEFFTLDLRLNPFSLGKLKIMPIYLYKINFTTCRTIKSKNNFLAYILFYLSNAFWPLLMVFHTSIVTKSSKKLKKHEKTQKNTKKHKQNC